MLQNIFSDNLTSFTFFLVLIASLTKRAQIPFSAWLPAAIAAPTPVSSLVHSRTLVTAGVYLLIRFHNMVDYSFFLFLISVLTIFISGLGANYEIDLKKIIALSTLSQLGVIIIVLSFGFFELAFFHLLRHALFKSLLFLCAGYYIHSYSDFQDVRSINSISYFSPIISFFFFCSSISLCGFPFLSGFYSKDIILEILLIRNYNFLIFILVLFSTIFTLTYSLRLFYFISFFNLGKKPLMSFRDESFIYFPITLLFFITTVGGRLMTWLFFPSYFIYLSFLTKTLILIFLFLFSLMLIVSFSLSLNILHFSKKINYFFRNI